MPAFSDLEKRIASDAGWNTRFRAHQSTAKQIAMRIHCGHVVGRGSPFEEIITTPPYELEVPKTSAKTTSTTRNSEEKLKLGRCIYFYAGKVHPNFGDAALAFGRNCEEGQYTNGSATPFDTGGLAQGHLDSNLKKNATTLARFTKDSKIQLSKWREKFSIYLAAYFWPLAEYWNGRPWKSDPEELMTRNDDWRAWVFEIRFQKNQCVLDCEAWCPSEAQAVLLRRRLRDLAPLGLIYPDLKNFLKRSIRPAGSPSYCEEIEAWIKEKIKL